MRGTRKHTCAGWMGGLTSVEGGASGRPQAASWRGRATRGRWGRGECGSGCRLGFGKEEKRRDYNTHPKEALTHIGNGLSDDRARHPRPAHITSMSRVTLHMVRITPATPNLVAHVYPFTHHTPSTVACRARAAASAAQARAEHTACSPLITATLWLHVHRLHCERTGVAAWTGLKHITGH